MNTENRNSKSVSPFSVEVLGGSFTVQEILLEDGQDPNEQVATIKATPEDRWFVMVSEDAASPQDSLAMIDDNLNFHVYALGQLNKS